MSGAKEIYPEFHRMLGRAEKERLLRQRGGVVWLYGMSGSGKSTVANALERRLHHEGRMTQLLDGDNIRTGLNADLGFSVEDRQENLRRIAEVARLFRDAGILTLVSFITPMESAREQARRILGRAELLMVYLEASFEACAERDPKGFYARGARGEMAHFTKEGMIFETPADPDLVLHTAQQTLDETVDLLYGEVSKRFLQHSP